MTSIYVAILKNQFPNKVLVALDSNFLKWKFAGSKATSVPSVSLRTIVVANPYSDKDLHLTAYDENNRMFYLVDGDAVYYFLAGSEHHPVYVTNHPVAIEDIENVKNISQDALRQSLGKEGSMKEGEARIFEAINSTDKPFPRIRVTVRLSNNSYQATAYVTENGTERSHNTFLIGLNV